MGRVYKELPAASELWERFEYNPLTGDLYSTRRSGYKPGESAGSLDKDGYLVTGASRFRNHRLIWKWVTGTDVPAGMTIDHVNRCRTDNSWANLRAVDESVQRANTAVRSNSGTGVKGVQLTPSGKYAAKINWKGVVTCLGTYPTADEAGAAYQKARLELQK